jgi:hypothetical protein
MHLSNTKHYRGTMVVTITKQILRNRNELLLRLVNYFVRTFAPYYTITAANDIFIFFNVDSKRRFSFFACSV